MNRTLDNIKTGSKDQLITKKMKSLKVGGLGFLKGKQSFLTREATIHKSLRAQFYNKIDLQMVITTQKLGLCLANLKPTSTKT